MSTINDSSQSNKTSKNCIYLLLALVLGALIGYFFGQTGSSDNGERIAKIAKQNRAPIAMLIGTDGLNPVNAFTGNRVSDCSSKSCRSKLQFNEGKLPILVDSVTNKPIKGASVQLLYQAAFKGSYCESYWSNGRYVEFCCEDDDPFC